MRTVAHISDMHFGREDPDLVTGLLLSLHQSEADLIVVSGDLTQRAKKRQFRAARAFLRDVPPVPTIVVPGNHDVSATNLLERTLRPLERYKRYITADLEPTFADDEVAVAGVNTVRVLSRKDGRINAGQVRTACEQLGRAPAEALRIVVTHHPMDVPQGDTKHPTVARAALAMGLFARCKVDLFLSGHLHSGLTIATSVRYKLAGYSAVVAHAGTAVSTRTRNEANGWNLIRLSPGSEGPATMEITRMSWNGKAFKPCDKDAYTRREDGWARNASRA